MTGLDQFVENPLDRTKTQPRKRQPSKRQASKRPPADQPKTQAESSEREVVEPEEEEQTRLEIDRWLRRALTLKFVGRAETFPRNGSSSRRTRLQSRLELGWGAKLGAGLRTDGLLTLRGDDADLARTNAWFREPDREIASRMRGELTEGTLGWSSRTAAISIGKQRFSFGKSDLFQPADIVSPRDLFEPFERDTKIGQLALSASYRFGEHFIEGIYLPWFVPSKLAPAGTRLSFFPFPGAPLLFEDPDFPAEHSLRDPQFAARISLHFDALDLELLYLDIYQRVANGLLRTRSLPTRLAGRVSVPSIQPVFPRLHIPGFAASIPIRELGVELHGEGIQVFTEDRHDDDYFQYVIGGRWTWSQPALADDELRITLEYGGEIITRRHRGVASTTPISRPFTQALFGRITYQLNRDLVFEVEGAVQLERRQHAALRTTASYRLNDYVSLTLGHEQYFGPSGTLFGQLRRDDRVFLEIEVKF